MIQHLHPYDILALGHVKRWHTVETARAQTLAEHTGRGAMLAVWLGHRLPVGQFDHRDELALWRAFMVHDMPKTQNGDVPNPSKQVLNRLESIDYDALMDGIFWEARGCGNPMATVSPVVLALLRLADVLEAACFYWASGLTERRPGQPPLKIVIAQEALVATERLLPELHAAVAEVLHAAGLGDELIDQLREAAREVLRRERQAQRLAEGGEAGEMSA